MQARRLLEEFKNCDADQFTAITDALEKENQGHLAKLLKKTMEDIKNEEANTGSDFVGNLNKNFTICSTKCKIMIFDRNIVHKSIKCFFVLF